ncbi:MAG: DNA primase [Gammaproteobacteria bacterium]|nr:DNA primase [Gammaproteobacteria bacterium]MDH5691665.1 DNA primase [Gammaproteobacteria bacterium]
MSGRIPEEFISDLLSRVDIVGVIDRRVTLKKSGREYSACCPFHSEKTPSFTVSPQKQFYHCFGCGAHGTAISFLMEFERLSFPEAIEELAREVGLSLPEAVTKPAFNEGAGPQADTEQLYALLERVNRFYQSALRKHPEKNKAVEYLKNRGISGQTAALYELGYAPSDWDSLNREFGANPQDRKNLINLGLCKHSNGNRPYDLMRDRIIFPIRNHRGKTIGFGARTLGDEQPKYLNSPESTVFKKGQELYGLHQIKSQRLSQQSILVVEGYMDVIALAQHGVPNATAALGTAFTEQHFSLLLRHTRNIVFCFDGDRAGRQAAWRAVENCLPRFRDGISLKFIFLPEGEDPDSYIRRFGQQGMEQLIDQSIPLSKFVIQHLMEQSPGSGMESKIEFVRLAKPIVQALEEESTFRALLIQELCKITGRKAEEFGANAPVSTQRKSKNYQGKRPTLSPVRSAITLLLHYPHLAHEDFIDLPPNSSEIAGVQLLSDIIDLVRTHPQITTAGILEHWRDTPTGNQLATLVKQDLHLGEQEVLAEFRGSLKKIGQQNLEGRMEELLNKSRYSSLNTEEKKELLQLLALNA